MVRKDKEGGYVLVTVAILLFVLVGFMALAIDTGVLLGARASSQRAADAAALAGAYTFLVNPTSVQPGAAILHAKQTAINNKVLGTSIADAQVDVQVVDVAPNPRRVTVTITRSEPTFLAKILNVDTVATKVTGVAEVGRTSTGTKCMKPFFLPNTILSTKAPCDACGSEVLVSGDTVTAWAIGKYGQQITITQQKADQSVKLASNQYYGIDVTGPGGDRYREAIGTCLPDFFVCRNSYNTLGGKKTGPTVQGVADLIGNPPDTYTSIGHYFHPADNTTRDMSKSVVLVPIWDLCNFVDPATKTPFCPTGDFPSGSGTPLQIIGFALVFINGISSGGDLTGELIEVIPCSTTPPTGVDLDAGTVLSVPLRLVRP